MKLPHPPVRHSLVRPRHHHRARLPRIAALLAATIALTTGTPGASAADESDDAQQESETDDSPTYRVATVDGLYDISNLVIANVPSDEQSEAQSDEQRLDQAMNTAAILGPLHAALSAGPHDVLSTMDPALALDTLEWAVATSEVLTDTIASNGLLVESLHGLESPEGLGDSALDEATSSAHTLFESGLGGFFSNLSGLLQDDGSYEPPEGSSGDAWEDYVNDPAPPGDSPDANDPEVDKTGDQWNDYLDDTVGPGDDPDLPDYGDDEQDSGEEEGEDDSVIVDNADDDDAPIVVVDPEGNVNVIDNDDDDDSSDDGSGDTTEDSGDDDGSGDTTTDDSSGTTTEDEDEGDDEEMPCNPDLDGCGNSGPPPAWPALGDDGTTQPGIGEQAGPVWPPLPEDDTGPLILVDPDRPPSQPTVIVARSPGYGTTQPPVDAYQSSVTWSQDAGSIEERINTLFARAAEQAAFIEELCGQSGCQ
ncbi:MAG: hypothetical protein K0V04_26405 [Deltaproteobacteria bacterium]|nr:hypothetical protein [Deltaproteobacteria bacterium]